MVFPVHSFGAIFKSISDTLVCCHRIKPTGLNPTVVASVNCLELPADGHFAWDMRWQGLKSLRENSTYKLSPEGTAESSPGR
jgi:hypothetical protein